MRRNITWTRVFFVNLLVLFALLGVLFLSPPAIFLIKNTFSYLFLSRYVPEDVKTALHVYNDFNWAETHFDELNAMSARYYDYVVWKYADFPGETINIHNGFSRLLKFAT